MRRPLRPLPPTVAAALVVLAAGACARPADPGAANGAPPAAPSGRAGAVAATPAPSSPPAAMRPLATDAHLLTSTMGPGGAPGVTVVRDAAAWEAAWAAVHQGATGDKPPAVDFAREMVVVVNDGDRSSGGHAVRVDGTSAGANGGLVLHVTRTQPGPTCMSMTVMTAPVDVVRVPRVAGPVTLEVKVVATPC